MRGRTFPESSGGMGSSRGILAQVSLLREGDIRHTEIYAFWESWEMAEPVSREGAKDAKSDREGSELLMWNSRSERNERVVVARGL